MAEGCRPGGDDDCGRVTGLNTFSGACVARRLTSFPAEVTEPITKKLHLLVKEYSTSKSSFAAKGLYQALLFSILLHV
jgi:hypothetical protein